MAMTEAKTTIKPRIDVRRSSIAGCVLKLNPGNPQQGVLSGTAFPSGGVQVRLLVKRANEKAAALVTNGTKTWMIPGECIVCGEAEQGQKRLEIMQLIYDHVQRGEFQAARQVFGQMHRLLL